jgi:hypothetical protein
MKEKVLPEKQKEKQIFRWKKFQFRNIKKMFLQKLAFCKLKL